MSTLGTYFRFPSTSPRRLRETFPELSGVPSIPPVSPVIVPSGPEPPVTHLKLLVSHKSFPIFLSTPILFLRSVRLLLQPHPGTLTISTVCPRVTLPPDSLLTPSVCHPSLPPTSLGVSYIPITSPRDTSQVPPTRLVLITGSVLVFLPSPLFFTPIVKTLEIPGVSHSIRDPLQETPTLNFLNTTYRRMFFLVSPSSLHPLSTPGIARTRPVFPTRPLTTDPSL